MIDFRDGRYAVNWNVRKITVYFDNWNQNNIWEYSHKYLEKSEI